ncbi:hypothetical protein SDC9_131397 [bioreactor metagenome]|uniref:Uncharacterized protein n=1 Tax=bioreactor metagenome TaxID=1076179 RepID=A0A645D4M6_9ZZZZ
MYEDTLSRSASCQFKQAGAGHALIGVRQPVFRQILPRHALKVRVLQKINAIAHLCVSLPQQNGQKGRHDQQARDSYVQRSLFHQFIPIAREPRPRSDKRPRG